MDKLNSEGIRFDEQGHIKIISEVTENNSKHLLGQIDLLVNGKYIVTDVSLEYLKEETSAVSRKTFSNGTTLLIISQD